MIKTHSLILLLTILMSGCASLHKKPETDSATLFYPSLPPGGVPSAAAHASLDVGPERVQMG